MAKGLSLVDVEVLIAKEMLCLYFIGHALPIHSDCIIWYGTIRSDPLPLVLLSYGDVVSFSLFEKN